jgi:hypothetical protein
MGFDASLEKATYLALGSSADVKQTDADPDQENTGHLPMRQWLMK